MRGKEEIAPEFGNAEQIALLKNAEQLLKDYTSEEGYCVEPSFDSYEVFTCEIGFNCVCGSTITLNGEDGGTWRSGDEDGAFEDAISRGSHSCSCGNKYTLTKDKDGDVVIKLKQPE